MKKIKIPKFGSKNALFGYFWAKILKNCYHIWNQHLRICLVAKFYKKTKIPKFGTKNAVFGFFWPKMFYLDIFQLEFENNYCYILNQHPRICLIAKFYEKVKIPKFGTKNVLCEYFWAMIYKNYCHTWNQHPRICLIIKFCKKNQKHLILGPKMSYLGICGLELLKTIVIFEISTLKFAKNESLTHTVNFGMGSASF